MPNPVRFHCLNTGKSVVSTEYPELTVARVSVLTKLIRNGEAAILGGRFLAKLDASTGKRHAELLILRNDPAPPRARVFDAGLAWWNDEAQDKAFNVAETHYLNASDSLHRYSTPVKASRYAMLNNHPVFDGTPYVGYHITVDEPELEKEILGFVQHLVIRLKAEFYPER